MCLQTEISNLRKRCHDLGGCDKAVSSIDLENEQIFMEREEIGCEMSWKPNFARPCRRLQDRGPRFLPGFKKAFALIQDVIRLRVFGRSRRWISGISPQARARILSGCRVGVGVRCSICRRQLLHSVSPS
jgi:hypothetical protein